MLDVEFCKKLLHIFDQFEAQNRKALLLAVAVVTTVDCNESHLSYCC